MSIFDRFAKKNAEASEARQRRRRMNELMEEFNVNIKEDRNRFFPNGGWMDPFLASIKKELNRYKTNVTASPLHTQAYFFLTEDHMQAFACLLPPDCGGEEITVTAFQTEMRYEGIVSGIQAEYIEEFVAGKKYLHVFPIAQGVAPKAGQDGAITELFEKCPVPVLDIAEGEEINFNEVPFQLVRKGEVICKIQPAVPGKDGIDVTGKTLHSATSTEISVPAGKNTKLIHHGTALVADTDGALSLQEGLWTVSQATIQMESLQGKNLDATGQLYVNGDVTDGARVICTGDILIFGEVRNANILSKNKSVRVMKGVSTGSIIMAKSQVQAEVISDSKVSAGQYIYACVMENSDVTSGGSIYVGGRHGLILGGFVKAKGNIACTKIGNLSGLRNHLAVGYMPELMEEAERIAIDITQMQDLLEKMRKTILGMRMAGESLPLEKRTILNKLVEQRDLMEQRKQEMQKRQKDIQQQLLNCRSGNICCQELNPIAEVQIGDRTGVFTYPEKNCNFHIYAGQVVVK